MVTQDFRSLIGRGAFAGEGVRQLAPPPVAPPPALVQLQIQRALEQEMELVRQSEIIAGRIQQEQELARLQRGTPQPEPTRETTVFQRLLPQTVQPTSPPVFTIPDFVPQSDGGFSFSDIGRFITENTLPGQLGAGATNFAQDAIRNITNPFQQNFVPPGAGALVADPATGQPTELGTTLNVADQFGQAGAAAGIEGITRALDPTLQNFGVTGTSFQDFINDASARREGAGLEELLTLRQTRNAFEESDINPAIKLAAEVAFDVTNLIPGAALSKPFRAAGTEALQAAARRAGQLTPPVPSLPRLPSLDDVLPIGGAQALGPEDVVPSPSVIPPVPSRDAQLIRTATDNLVDKTQRANLPPPPESLAKRELADETIRLTQQAEEVDRIGTKIQTHFADNPPISRRNRADIIEQGRSERAGLGEAELRAAREDPASDVAAAQVEARLAQEGEIVPRLPVPLELEVNEISTLRRHILDTNSRTYTTQNTDEALVRLIDGRDPAPGDVTLLSNALGRETMQAFIPPASAGSRTKSFVRDGLGIPKTLKSAFDLSAPLRQGLLLSVSDPGAGARAFRDMFGSFSSNRAFRINDEILRDPDIEAMMNLESLTRTGSGKSRTSLFMQPVKDAGSTEFLSKNLRDEAFISAWAEKIPGVGVSARTFGTFLNKLKHDTGKRMLNNWRKDGSLPAGPLNLDDLSATQLDKLESTAKFLNVMTGRSTWPEEFLSRETVDMLNVAFWSPRLALSRIQAPTLIRDPNIRKEVFRAFASTIGLGATILGALEAALPEATVEKDPRSSDFGKLRIGRSRLDFWGGFQQIARYATQIATDEKKPIPEPGEPIVTGFGQGEFADPENEFFGSNRAGTSLRFIRSKFSPGIVTTLGNEFFNSTFLDSDLAEPPERGRPPEVIGDFIRGDTGNLNLSQLNPNLPDLDNPLSANSARVQDGILQVIPLFPMEFIDALEEYGVIGAAVLGIPAIFGVGTSTFNEELTDREQRLRSGDTLPDGATGRIWEVPDAQGNEQSIEILDQETIMARERSENPGLSDQEIRDNLRDERFESLNSNTGKITNKQRFPRSRYEWLKEEFDNAAAEGTPVAGSTPGVAPTQGPVPTPFVPSVQPTPGTGAQAPQPTATPVPLPTGLPPALSPPPTVAPGAPTPAPVPQPTRDIPQLPVGATPSAAAPGTTGQTWEYIDSEGSEQVYQTFTQPNLLSTARQSNPQASEAGLYRILKDARYDSRKKDGGTARRQLYPKSKYPWLYEPPPLVPGSIAYEDIINSEGIEKTIPVWSQEELMRRGREQFPGLSDADVMEALRDERYESLKSDGMTSNKWTYRPSQYPWLYPD